MKTGLVSAFPVGSGTYTVLICTDVYSQVQRFAQNTNCSVGDGLSISARTLPRSSGPVPTTIVRTGLATVSRSSTAVFRFVSAGARRGFQCSLDGGPWLACRSPQRYRALVGGAHGFDVRATSVSGTDDRAQAHRSWTVDTVRPAVTLRRPVSGSTTHNTKPAFSGTAGTMPGNSSTIRVKLFRGSGASGSPLRTLVARVSGGSWSVAPTKSLARGTYTAQAEQSNSAGKTGLSRPHAFTIDTRLPARVGRFLGIGAATAAASKTYSIGGTVSGLSGTVVLQDNGSDNLSVSRNGAFTFAKKLPTGAAYNVTVKTNPAGQTCTVSDGTGTVASANVTSVAVTCKSNTYSIGGSVSGLSGTVVLQDNGGDDLSVSANGAFAFATKLPTGAAYNVTVKTNPAGQTCTVANGSGTVGSANVTSVAVTCKPNTYSIGGSVSGLSGTVVLQDNGGDDLSVSANGAFAFATKLPTGAAYNVTVKTNPAGQTCTVANGSGTVALSERHQRRGHLQAEHVFDRWVGVWVVGDGGVAGQRW